MRDALRVFAVQPNLAAIVVAGYNPELDPDGESARRLVDLLVEVLAARLETGSSETTGGIASAAAVSGSTSSGGLQVEPAHDSSEAPRAAPEPATEVAPDMQEPPEPDSIPS